MFFLGARFSKTKSSALLKTRKVGGGVVSHYRWTWQVLGQRETTKEATAHNKYSATVAIKMMTFFNKVRSFTLSSKETSTVAVDLTGVSLKSWAVWSKSSQFCNVARDTPWLETWVVLFSLDIVSISFLSDLVLSDSENRLNSTHSTNLADVVYTFTPSQFIHDILFSI